MSEIGEGSMDEQFDPTTPAATVTVAPDWDDNDPCWYEESSIYEVRRRIPTDLWQRYQQARDATRAAAEAEWGIFEEIRKAGDEIPAACRHANKGCRWSADDGLTAICACGEEFPWTDPCPHPLCTTLGDKDVCVACGVDLPYVVVPMVGGPKDGETTHFHGEWNPYSFQIMVTDDSLNYRLRNDEGGLRYVFSAT